MRGSGVGSQAGVWLIDLHSFAPPCSIFLWAHDECLMLIISELVLFHQALWTIH